MEKTDSPAEPPSEPPKTRTPLVWPGFLIVALMFAPEILGDRFHQIFPQDPTPSLGLAAFIYFYFCVYRMHGTVATATKGQHFLTADRMMCVTFIPRLVAFLICVVCALYAVFVPPEWLVAQTIISTAAFLAALFIAIFGDLWWTYDMASFINGTSEKRRLNPWLPGIAIIVGYLITIVYCRIGFCIAFASLTYLNWNLATAIKSGAIQSGAISSGTIQSAAIISPAKSTATTGATTSPFLAVINRLREKVEPKFFSIVVPVAMITTLSIVIAFIWLAVLGEWNAIGWGLFDLFVLPWSLYVILIPCMLINKLAPKLSNDRSLKFASDFLVLSYVYYWAAYFCSGVITYFPQNVQPHALVPASIWAFAVAVIPCIAVANRCQDDVGSMISLLLIEITTVILLIVTPFMPVTVYQSFVWFGIVLLTTAFFQALLAIWHPKEEPLWTRTPPAQLPVAAEQK